MAAAALALSFGLVELDTQLDAETVRKVGWLYTFGPEGARAILSAIASSMITVAGLTFSITMLTLQLASSQFGPRLLRNFMRDRGNQIVLGTFISTFVYCLLVLRTVRGTEDSHFVPHIAVAFGVFFALASIGVLIYFIHHVTTSIRIEMLLANLAEETHAAIDRLYPEGIGREPPEDRSASRMPIDFEARAQPVAAAASGYVQRTDMDSLMRVATEHDLVVRIEARPGRFVSGGVDALLMAYPRERVSDEQCDALRDVFIVGRERTPEQDVQFSVRRIVEIAQRALSPGVNDPTTALYCMDRLVETLGSLATREVPSPLRLDAEGRPRVLTEATTLGDVACPAFAAVARYGLGDADVMAALLDAMQTIIVAAPPHERRPLVDLQADIRAAGVQAGKLAHDRHRLRQD